MLNRVNIKQTNIFALLCCGFYLLANIYYDWVDIPCEYNCPTAVDARIYFIPLSLMIFAISLLCKKHSPKNTEPYWWAIVWLSIMQMTKFIGFNPYFQMISDYFILGLITIGLIYKLIKNARPLPTGSN